MKMILRIFITFLIALQFKSNGVLSDPNVTQIDQGSFVDAGPNIAQPNGAPPKCTATEQEKKLMAAVLTYVEKGKILIECFHLESKIVQTQNCPAQSIANKMFKSSDTPSYLEELQTTHHHLSQFLKNAEAIPQPSKQFNKMVKYIEKVKEIIHKRQNVETGGKGEKVPDFDAKNSTESNNFNPTADNNTPMQPTSFKTPDGKHKGGRRVRKKNRRRNRNRRKRRRIRNNKRKMKVNGKVLKNSKKHFKKNHNKATKQDGHGNKNKKKNKKKEEKKKNKKKNKKQL